jgi:hypothetical protein
MDPEGESMRSKASRLSRSLAFVITGLIASSIPARAASSASGRVEEIKKANTEVALIKRQIEDGKLAQLKFEYGLPEATERVPPEVHFYFEVSGGKSVLRASTVSVGNETWSREFDYFYSADSSPLKYLETISGLADPSAPKAIIYGKADQVLWKNLDRPRVDPHEMQRTFESLSATLKSFSGN